MPVPPLEPSADVLARLDRFLDAIVRDATDAHDVGVMRVLLSRRPWPYYARPRSELDLSGPGAVTAADVRAAAALLSESGAPVAFEWILERVPSMADAVAEHGLPWTTAPLQAMRAAAVEVPAVDGVALRLLGPGDPATAAAVKVVAESFGSPFVEDPGEVDARIRSGRTHVVVAEADGEVVGVCSLSRIDDVAEVYGAGTLHRHRRRGIGRAMVSHLVRHAHGLGIELLLLSASEDGVRIYEEIGFRTVGTLAEAPPDA